MFRTFKLYNVIPNRKKSTLHADFGIFGTSNDGPEHVSSVRVGWNFPDVNKLLSPRPSYNTFYGNDFHTCLYHFPFNFLRLCDLRFLLISDCPITSAFRRPACWLSHASQSRQRAEHGHAPLLPVASLTIYCISRSHSLWLHSPTSSSTVLHVCIQPSISVLLAASCPHWSLKSSIWKRWIPNEDSVFANSHSSVRSNILFVRPTVHRLLYAFDCRTLFISTSFLISHPPPKFCYLGVLIITQKVHILA